MLSLKIKLDVGRGPAVVDAVHLKDLAPDFKHHCLRGLRGCVILEEPLFLRSI